MENTFMPMQGVKVVDCCVAGAGPSCTKLLREYGAQVIWVEPLNGTNTRSVHKYDFYTTGKRSLAINLKAKEGMGIMERLLSDADVFVSNYRPGALKRLGLNYDHLKERYPRLICATITGYGEEGDDSNQPGYDPVVFWARGGMMRDIAEKGSLVVPPIAIGDISTGLTLAGGVATALFDRERTGKGCHIFTSLMAVAAYLNHDAEIEVQYGEEYPKSRLSPRRALLNTYRCKDDRWITITIVSDFKRYFNPLLKALGREDLIGDSRWNCIEDTMYCHASELVKILDEAFLNFTQDEAIYMLRAIDVPASKVQSSEEFVKDPQAKVNGCFYQLAATVPPDKDKEKIWVPASPLKFNTVDSGTSGFGKGPRLGEHTDEILREYGYNETEIRTLSDNGIVKN